MPTARGNVGAAVINGRIYVPGGYDGTAATPVLDVLEIHDIASDTWSSGAPMPTPLSGAAVAAYGGTLYTFGGSTASGDVASTYAYDPASDTWTEKAPMPGGARSYAAAAELNGLIYVAGGWPSLNVVEVYDPVSDSWSTASSLKIGRQAAGLVAAGDGYLYISGGGNAWTGLDSAERYDPASDTWTVIPSLNDADRAGSASAYVAGRVFAAGGSGVGLSSTNESLQLSDSFCNSRKSAWRSSVGPGERLTYTVEIHSDPVTLTGASLVDPIPDGTTWAGFGRNPIGAAYNSGADRVEWSGSVPVGTDPLTFTFGVDVDAAGWTIGDPITNVVTFDSGAGLAFDKTTVTRLTFVDPSPSVKTVDKGRALAGDVLSYTIEVANGSAISDTFVLRDPIPLNTTYVSGTLTTTVGTTWYHAGEDAVYWTGVLPARGGYLNTSGDYEWGDSNGNGTIPGVTFQWQDMTGATNTGVSADDGAYGSFPIGFSFNFYGNDYVDFYVSPNGWVGFESTAGTIVGCPDYGSSGTPDNFIGGFGGDRAVYSGDGGSITYKLFGSAPNRILAVQFTNVRYVYYSTADFLDMQILLYEGSNAILVQYQDLSTSPTTSSFGIEGPGPGYSSRIYQDTCPATIEEGLSVLFLPDGAAWGLARADVTFVVSATAVLPFNTWITNTATITGPYGAVNRSAGTLVNPVNLAASTKTANRNQAGAGEKVTYDLLLDNSGLLTATGATLSDPIPAHTTYVSGSLDYGDGMGAYGSGVITWTGDVPPGGAITLTFAVTLTEVLDDLTPVTNTATLDDGAGSLYYLEEVFLARSSDLSRSFKTADPRQVAPGGVVTYTVYVYNSGVVDTPGEMRDELGPELSVVPGSVVCSSGSCGEASGVITWTGTAYGRSMVPVRFQATVDSALGQGDLVTNTATITDDVRMAGYPAAVTVAVVEAADLWVTKVGAREVEARGLLSYTLVYANDGPHDADDPVQVVDVLPAGATYAGSLPTGAYSPTAGTVTWDVGALTAGISGTLVLTVRVDADTPPLAVLTNTASISVLPQDVNPANNTAQWTTEVYPASNTYGVRLRPSTASAAGVPAVPVYYTLQVDNDGTAPDTFDVAVHGNGWPTEVPATIGPLAAGGYANLVVAVNVPSAAPVGSTDRATVTVTSRGDPFESADAVLTTTASGRAHSVYLPVLMRGAVGTSQLPVHR
jgi:uncharacterized repeat protein (TIGR01451 family)